MGSIAPTERDVIGGVDTHLDLHMAAVVEPDGTVLGVQPFSTTRAGYRAMLGWVCPEFGCLPMCEDSSSLEGRSPCPKRSPWSSAVTSSRSPANGKLHCLASRRTSGSPKPAYIAG
jgi:hypothetical protein